MKKVLNVNVNFNVVMKKNDFLQLFTVIVISIILIFDVYL